jgi:RNA polymerase sigma-70 factor (ECF subfamily)
VILRVSYSGSTKVSKTFSGGSIPSTRAEMKNISDEKLVTMYLKGDEKALEELVRRYLSLIYGFSRKYAGDPDMASDISQEVFVKVWKNLKKFDTSKNFRNWIFVIAKNTALDWLKKKNALSLGKDMSAQGGPASGWENNIPDLNQPSMIDRFYNDSVSQKLALAINQLPSKYGKVIKFHNQENLNFREISEKFGESVNTIKSRYRRGLILLKKYL